MRNAIVIIYSRGVLQPSGIRRFGNGVSQLSPLRPRLDYIIPPNFKETITNSIKLRFDESSRTSLTGLSVLLRNAMFIFTLMNPVRSILGRRHRFRSQ